MAARPVRILAISGSLRAGSYNTALLRAAEAMAGPRAVIEVATLHGIPLYDGDVEQSEGAPPAVAELKARVIASDGLLLGTPEYNNGIPGVFKNAIDWLSRPSVDIPKVFGGRPVALLGASPGRFGTVLSQNAWLPVLRLLGVRLWTGRLMVSAANRAFDENGALTDEAVRKQLLDFVKGFVEFVESARGG
jgi:NAD(P)H-dependent FMN reductase